MPRQIDLIETNIPEVYQKISSSWDRNVCTRAQDLLSGTDTTYNDVILPWVISTLSHSVSKDAAILDAGCGCGFLTSSVFNHGWKNIVGVDISPVSISYAQSCCPQIRYICGDACGMLANGAFDTILAVMTINNLPNASAFLHNAFQMLNVQGKLIIVIPHPVVWPIKHLPASSFTYSLERCYEFPFSTKGRKDYPSSVFYFHRPLDLYIRYIREAGFFLEIVTELYEPGNHNLPDLLGLVLTKKNIR